MIEPEPTSDVRAVHGAWFRAVPALGAVAALVGYALVAAFGSGRVQVAAPLAALAFAVVQMVFPASRPSRTHVVSPLNWAVLAFFLQLVVMPLTVSWVGPELGVLPYLPGPRAMDEALALSIGSFVAFGIGCTLSARRRGSAPRRNATRIPRSMILAYAALGLVGLLVGFGSLREMFAALADPARFTAISAKLGGTLGGAASTFLRPFLLSAIAMAWCVWADRRGATAPRPLRYAITAVAAVGMVIVGSTYAFNRASFMVPLVAMAAAYSSRVRRVSLGTLAVVGTLLAWFALAPARYRTGDITADELAESSAAREQLLVGHDVSAQIQVYGGAPQFAGYLLESADRTNAPFTPEVLLGSLLYPVPILGKGFRDTSGPAVYNRLIYGGSGILDQLIPFEAEVYLCLGPAGLLAACVLFGLAVGRLQRAFENASSAFDTYALQFVGMWTAFLVQGSLSAVAQAFVFFMWPIYGYAVLREFGALRREPALPGDVAAV